ncbi:hypothetical protein Tco_0940087 [Tanacetum coccineum]|uniref:Uncharacterized protein n=1 Tax=Tanacetum coccineum TaxID=301880 RepID=A0ABQ5DMS1_9ASTR
MELYSIMLLCPLISDKVGFVFARELTFLLLSSYGAIVGKKDTGIYKIMQELECLEKSTKNYIADMDYLWGTAAIRVRKERETEHVLSSDDTYDIEKHQKVNSEITFQLTSECVELLFFSFCDDDSVLFSARCLSRPVTWLGSHTSRGLVKALNEIKASLGWRVVCARIGDLSVEGDLNQLVLASHALHKVITESFLNWLHAVVYREQHNASTRFKGDINFIDIRKVHSGIEDHTDGM